MRSNSVPTLLRWLACVLSVVLATAARAGEVRSNAPALLSSEPAEALEETLYHEGSSQYAAGQYAQALASLGRFADEHPDSPRRSTALLGCAWSLIKLERLDEARGYLQPLAADPVIGCHARRWLQWLETAQAERASSESPAPGTPSPSASPASQSLSDTAWTEYRAGHLPEAAAAFAQLLQSEPEPEVAAEAALVRGQILQKLQRPDAALAMYDLVLEKHFHSARYVEALWAAAQLRDDLEQDQQAVAMYRRLAKTCPQFTEMDALLYRQAWALCDLGGEAEASPLFTRLLQDFPESRYWADVALHQAQRELRAKDYTAAEQLVRAVLDRKPEERLTANAQYLRGQIAAAQERWPEARQAFAAVIATAPESPWRLQCEYGIAESYFRQGEYAEAAARFEALIRQSQGCREPWMVVFPLRQAQALGHQQRWEEAYAVASRIASDYPQSERPFEVDYLLGRCLASQAEYQQAREAYQRVLRSPAGSQSETAARAQLMLGESYFQQKDYASAAREFMRLLREYPHPALQELALLQAAKCQELQDEPAAACRLYQELIDHDPQGAYRPEAEARLAKLQPSSASPSSPKNSR